MKYDPYNDNKIYHKGHLVDKDGNVSPLCAKKPRKINLSKELWAFVDSSVTCKKCLKILQEKSKENE